MNQSRSSTLALLRSIYRELRPTLSTGQKFVYTSSHWRFIVETAKKHKDSSPESEKFIRMGQSYLSYLEGKRNCSDIRIKYRGKGERTPGDLATILGFRMPDFKKEEATDSKVAN